MAQYRVGRNRCWKLNPSTNTWETISCSQVPSQRSNNNRGIRKGFRRADGGADGWDTEDVSASLYNELKNDDDIINDKPMKNASGSKETKGYDYNNQDIMSFEYADGDFQYMDADCGIMMNADGFLDDLSANGHILRGRKDGHPSKRQSADGVDDTDKGDMYADSNGDVARGSMNADGDDTFGTGGGFDADFGADGLKKKEFIGGKFITVNKIPFWEQDAKEGFLKSAGLINKDVAVAVSKAVKKTAYKKGKRGNAMFSQINDGSGKWIKVSHLQQRAKKIKF